MAREYSLNADNQTVVAAPQLTFINPPAGGVAGAGFEVIRAWCSQRANATSAQQGIRLGSKVTVFPTLVSATPNPLKLTDPASKMPGNTTGAAGTSGINSSANGAGAEVGIYPDNFNALNGWLWVATPTETTQFMPGGTSGHFMQFTNTPGTLTGWSWGVIFRELG
jgi:hypothetical protein